MRALCLRWKPGSGNLFAGTRQHRFGYRQPMFKRADLWCFVCGTALFLHSVYYMLLGIEMAHDGVAVQGVVIRNERSDPSRKPEEDPVYGIVEFTDQAGRKHEVRTATGRYPPQFSIGDKVDLFHLKGKPESARLANFQDRYWKAITGMFFSNVLLIIGVIIVGVESLAKRWRQRKERPAQDRA